MCSTLACLHGPSLGFGGDRGPAAHDSEWKRGLVTWASVLKCAGCCGEYVVGYIGLQPWYLK